METVVFNGVSLTDSFTVADIKRPLPTPTPTYETVPGGDRNFMRGMELTPPVISFRVMLMNADTAAIRRAERELASILLVKEPVKVQFGSDDGLYYMAVPQGDIPISEFVRCGSMVVTLLCEEAAMYGEARKASGSSGGSVSFDVGGTYKTRLKVTCSNAASLSSGIYGVRLDGAGIMKAVVTTAGSSVVMDSQSRVVKVNNAVRQLTLDSDWFEVSPGKHTVENHLGGGAFTVEWVERWL